MSKSHREIDEYYRNGEDLVQYARYESETIIAQVCESSRRVDSLMCIDDELDIELNGPQEFEAQRLYCDFVHRLQAYASPEVERSTKILSIELIMYIQDQVKNNS